MVKNKGQEVTVPAPVVIVPDQKDKPEAVWIDRGQWWHKIQELLKEKKWPIEKIKQSEGAITIRFSNKDHAIMFCLSYDREEYETEIF